MDPGSFTGFMAAFALAAFWLNTLLIAGAACSECAALRRRYAFLASGTGRGVVRAGDGPAGVLARWCVVQVGRSNGRGPIVLHDRSRTSQMFGGVLEVAGAQVRLDADVDADAVAEVWVGATTRRGLVARPDRETFASVVPAATRAAGWERTVEASLGVGDVVWLARAEPAGDLRFVLAESDPRRWLTWITVRTAVLVIGLLVIAGACTVVCLWPPVFATISKLGALAALVAFNLFQLAGKLHHDAIQPPAQATLGGTWARPR